MLIQRQGDVRPYRRARTWLVATSILASGLAAPALAQNAAPEHVEIDANGVDLINGTYNPKVVDVSIGPDGLDGLTYERLALARPLANQYDGRVNINSAGEVSVTIGNISEKFALSGSTYVPVNGGPSKLTRPSSTVWVYEKGDGTQYTLFRDNVTDPSILLTGISEIKYPSGQKITQHWVQRIFTIACPQRPCPTTTRQRLSSITNSSGYQFKFGYAQNWAGAVTPATMIPGWITLTKIQAINNQIDACNPTADTCTGFTRNWPQATYTQTIAGAVTTVDVVNDRGEAWRYTSSGTSAGIKPPSAASDTTVVTFGTSGMVSAHTENGITTNYNFADASGVRTATVTAPDLTTTIVKSAVPSGLRASVEDALGKKTEYSYDTSGRLAEVKRPEGDKTVFGYDTRGNATSVTRKAKAGSGLADIVTTSSYPATCTNQLTCNQPDWTKDARGQQTDYTYDATHGGILTVTQPADANGIRPQTRYGYTLTGGGYRLTSVSACRTGASCVGTADETKTTIGHDANFLPNSVTTGAGDGNLVATTTATRDAIGDVVSVDGPLAGADDTTTYRYASGRRLEGAISADPDGAGALKRRAQKTTYTADGEVATVESGTVTGTDDIAWAAFVPAEKVTSTWTNGLKTKDVLSSGGTDYAVTQYGYNSRGLLVCVAQRMDPAQWGTQSDSCTPQLTGPNGPDRVQQRGLDALGRVVDYHHAFGTAAASHEYVSFTDNGQTQTVTDGQGNKTTYEYDGHDRLKKTRYPEPSMTGSSSTIDYEELDYDAGSNVTSARLRDGQVIGLAYDNLSRLTTKDLPGGNPDTSYSYDLAGRMTGATRSDGQALSFGYDALGRNISAGANLGTLTYQYDLAGRRTRITHPDSFYFQYEHLVTGEVMAIRDRDATALVSFAYDDLGRRTSLTRANGTSTSYAYDPVSRLASLGHDLAGAANDVSFSFTHDPASGIATRTRDNDTYAFPGFANVNRSDTLNGLNQMTATGGTGLTHDARGNITGIGSASYGYDIENRMTSGGSASAIGYDPLGRLRQIVSSVSTRGYLWDGNDLVLEYDGSNQITRRYVHGPGKDEPLVTYGTPTGDVRWLHADERGSIIALSSPPGTSAGISSYDEYGVPSGGDPFGYTGQLWLPELGMHYYKARTYNPSLGRFMQADPIGYGDGLNLYGYVKGDPVNRTDPHGTQCYVNGRVSFLLRSFASCEAAGGTWETTVTGSVNPGPVRPRPSERPTTSRDPRGGRPQQKENPYCVTNGGREVRGTPPSSLDQGVVTLVGLNFDLALVVGGGFTFYKFYDSYSGSTGVLAVGSAHAGLFGSVGFTTGVAPNLPGLLGKGYAFRGGAVAQFDNSFNDQGLAATETGVSAGGGAAFSLTKGRIVSSNIPEC